ncbi:AraC family transcriptional regulator [Paraburkholderia silviterrae]|uniref:AraC family transcriptional regulator n=1 Tax=Paraburkholderia silviterrae TaxID=2528715 RepID=A0A4R5LZ66_9BURK|nr:AraC family transcriptional regulator [Paraburkholderia silviterrae]TDG17959.1 AraC family transcriptional regulator [Paraburkholderia silviterrae]
MQPTALQIEPSALRQYRYFESADLEDTCERIASVLQPHRLTPGPGRAGRKASYMNYVRFDNLSFGSLGYASPMRVDAGEISDYFLLLMSLDGYADVSVGGRRVMLSPTQGIVVSPSMRFDGIFSGDCEQFFVRVDKHALLAHSGYERLSMEPTIDLARPQIAPLLAQLRMLATSPETVALAQQNRHLALDIERLLVTLLLCGHPHSSADRPSTAVLPRTLRRAEAYIAEHACEPLTLTDIADAAGIPVRTLLHGFKRLRNTSPMQLVRTARIERSREMLMKADVDARVGDIALACGFANLGRFASAYRETYGETPSETLRRVQARIA